MHTLRAVVGSLENGTADDFSSKQNGQVEAPEQATSNDCEVKNIN
jgi:hypothetical protein